MIDSLLPIMGTRVLIRKLNKEDLKPLYELEIDKDVKRYVGGPVTKSQQEWIEEKTELCSRQIAVLPLIITCKATGDFAGRASLSPQSMEEGCWEIQVLIAKKYWGHHFGREVTELLMGIAFGDLRASSVLAIVDPKNEASLNLVKDLGFTHVSTKQSDRWDNGHYEFQRKSGLS